MFVVFFLKKEIKNKKGKDSLTIVKHAENTQKHCLLACQQCLLTFLYFLGPSASARCCSQQAGPFCINEQSRQSLTDMP